MYQPNRPAGRAMEVVSQNYVKSLCGLYLGQLESPRQAVSAYGIRTYDNPRKFHVWG